jgi:hypothetical protein
MDTAAFLKGSLVTQVNKDNPNTTAVIIAKKRFMKSFLLFYLTCVRIKSTNGGFIMP